MEGVRRSTPERNEPDGVATADDEEGGPDELTTTGLMTCDLPRLRDADDLPTGAHAWLEVLTRGPASFVKTTEGSCFWGIIACVLQMLEDPMLPAAKPDATLDV